MSNAALATEEDRAGATSVALLPQRHPNHDLFICDVLDAIPKDDMASMEHPIFSLATKADTRVLRYEHRNAVVEIAPSVRGLATISHVAYMSHPKETVKLIEEA